MHCRYIIGSYSLVQCGTIATIRLEFEFSVAQNTRQRQMHSTESVDQRFVLNDSLDVDFVDNCKQRHDIVVLNKLMERVNNVVLSILGNFLLFLLGLSYVLMCLFGYQGIFLLVCLQSIWGLVARATNTVLDDALEFSLQLYLMRHSTKINLYINKISPFDSNYNNSQQYLF